jgi:hypothetical protein
LNERKKCMSCPIVRIVSGTDGYILERRLIFTVAVGKSDN